MIEINDLENSNKALEDLKANEFKKPGLMQTGILYTVSILLFAFIGSRVQKNNFTSGVLITEFILILIPPLFLLLFYKYDLKKVLRLNKLGLLNAILIIFIMIFALPVVGVLNSANLALIKYIFGKIIVEQPPMLTGPYSLIYNILLIAGTAGICEETMYRGVVLRGFERFGTGKAILASAVLFSLAHFDFQKFLGIVLLGCLIGFIVYRTNSLFGGMLAHFTNNAIAVLLTALADFLRQQTNKQNLDSVQSVDQYFASLANMPREQLIAAIIFAIFLLLVCAVILAGLLIGLTKNTENCFDISIRSNKEVNSFKPLLWFMPGLIMVGFVYFAEGFKLRGLNFESVNIVLKFIGLK